MKGWRFFYLICVMLAGILIVSGCTWFDGEYPRKELLVDEPGGAILTIDSRALDQRTEIIVEDVGAGEPLGGSSPLLPASNEYFVDIGEADQIGAITMTVPLYGGGKDSSLAAQGMVYMTWAEPFDGTPSVVGTIVEDNQAEFPVVGPGKYQVYAIASHDALMAMFTIFDPLAVPTYQQRTPAWCSPTAMTNLARFHQGSWQTSGKGKHWSETSNYYLAGQAGQPFDHGYFFHWLLGAGGYSVPSNVKQSFSDGNVEVIIWNWKALVDSGFSNPAYANALFNFFQAYVESYLWGANSDRRPVAWGSSLAGHSRTITGSNGDVLFYNDPGSGSLNQTRSWETYRSDIIASLTAEKIEVIDTVVFHAPPRPEEERTGVIWLYPSKTDGYPGSVAMKSGETGNYITNWHWDGSGSHSYGYYYEDLGGSLESDSAFGVQFESLHFEDLVELSYGVKNITDQSREYRMRIALVNDGDTVNELVHEAFMTIPAGGRHDNNPAETFTLSDKPAGLYYLWFALSSGETITDIKWVQFRIHPPEKIFINKQAFCRFGPDPVFDGLAIFDQGTEVVLLGTNPERTWGLFTREVDGEPLECWMAFSVVDNADEEDVPVVPVPPMPVEEKEPDKPGFSCSRYDNDVECMADSRCTWVFGLAQGYCTGK